MSRRRSKRFGVLWNWFGASGSRQCWGGNLCARVARVDGDGDGCKAIIDDEIVAELEMLGVSAQAAIGPVRLMPRAK